MKTDSQVSVRPLNPDNEVEIQHLVALFERCRDSGVLSSSVFIPRFWKGAAGRRFSSLIALCDGKIVAHCGFGTERNSPGLALLTHLMVDPNYADQLESLVQGFEELLTAQMRRKGLFTLLALRHSESSALVEEFMRDLHLLPVAQLPDKDRGVEIWARLFERGSRSLQFVPMNLRGTVASVYRSLGVRAATKISGDDGPSAVSADDLAVEPFPVSRTGRAFLFVTPSLLRQQSRAGWMPEALEQSLDRWPHAVIAVRLSDPGCSGMAQLLQSHGFSYLGIIPAFRGRDSILFSRVAGETETRDSTGLSRRSQRMLS